MRFTNLLFSLFALLLATTGYSNRIYLDYDSGCMDVYEYQFIGDNSGKIQVVYHIKLNDREKVILETFINKDTRLPKKPSKTRSCGDLSINERTVRQINSGDLDLYILRKNGRNYNVSMVKAARYAQVSSSSTGYSMPDARFSYKFSQPANGIDLASKGSNAAVYFKGTLSHECPKKYLFNKTSSSGDRNYTEFIVIPEIGIIEEKSGINENDAARNVKTLIKVNGKPVNDYVQNYCSAMTRNGSGKFFRGGAGTVDDPSGPRPTKKEFESSVFQKPSLRTRIANAKEHMNNTDTGTGQTGTGTVVVTNNPPVSASNCTFYKDIDKGLYFDWTTGALANGSCGGNKYSNGYLVGGPLVNTNPNPPVIITNPNPPVIFTNPNPPVIIDPAPPVVNTSDCANQSRYGVHVVQRNETLYGIARIYGVSHKDLIQWNNLNRKGLIQPCMQLLTRANQPAAAPIETDYVSQYHQVNQNETLYGIARKHGYTVDRLRKMNGMGSSDKLYVGQQIKVSDCNCPADSQLALGNTTRNTPTSFNETGGRINTSGAITSNPVQRKYHVVKENDTVYSIAKKYGVSVASLRSINDLEENEIIIPYQRIYLSN